MSIFLSRNQQHKIAQQKQAELNKYRNMISGFSDELIKWLKDKDLTIADFENLIDFTKQRFEITYGKSKIKQIQD